MNITVNHNIDASNFNNSRCEFQLPKNKVLLSKIRLMNLGLTNSTCSGNVYALYTTAGVKGLIKNLTLMDGSTVLDQIQNFNLWSNYKNYNTTNDNNSSVNNWLSANAQGFAFQTNTLNGDLALNKIIDMYNTRAFITSQELTTFKGVLSLDKEMNLLMNMPVLNTSVFQNLRLVIEWETNYNLILVPENSEGDIVNGTNSTLLRPFIEVQEVVDMNVAKQLLTGLNNVSFTTVENNKQFIAQIPAGSTETQNNYKIKSFNQKFVNKLVFVKSDIGVPYKSTGDFGRLQVKLNGKSMLPFNGLDGPNKRLAYSTICGHTHNLLPNSITEYEGTLNVSNEYPNICNDNKNKEFVCLTVNDRVSDLQVELLRNVRIDSAAGELKAAYNHVCFGLVQKQVIINNGSYAVMYV